MEHPGFFERSGPFPLQVVVERAGARAIGDVSVEAFIVDVRPLDVAGPDDVSFFENAKYLRDFESTGAAACFVAKRFVDRTPPGTCALECDQPYRAFALALSLFYPDALRPRTAIAERPNRSRAVHPTARLEEDVRVEPSAVIGAEARIGRGTVVGAGAVIGYRVHVGRECVIGPGATLTNALVGDRVIVHAGARIGQDGFGFAMGREGHLKVPQIGRVVVQDDVEIGANTTVDRGTLRDTIIGEGTKIDNLVQIGHNVVIGRHCVIAGQTGISGSTELGDFVALGGQVGVLGHVRIGEGAQIAASSNVNRNVPPGATWGGSPAKPMRMWFRETVILKRLAEDAEAKSRGHRSDT